MTIRGHQLGCKSLTPEPNIQYTKMLMDGIVVYKLNYLTAFSQSPMTNIAGIKEESVHVVRPGA